MTVILVLAAVATMAILVPREAVEKPDAQTFGSHYRQSF